MKLYDVTLSPFAARCRVQIYAKGLDIARVDPPGGLGSDAYKRINPTGKVPALELEDGSVLPESSVIAEYLEDRVPEPSLRPADPAARGKYLVTILGCGDCHTPLMMGPNGPETDMSRWLSGHPETPKLPPPPTLDPAAPWNWAGAATLTAFAGPWGVTFATNLTPDSLTGMGIWTEEMFVRALREGKHMATSRPIQPPMPWLWYRQMTDEDLKAVYAYLRTIPPLRNQVPDYIEPAPRTGM